jgi:hypothetical protein
MVRPCSAFRKVLLQRSLTMIALKRMPSRNHTIHLTIKGAEGGTRTPTGFPPPLKQHKPYIALQSLVSLESYRFESDLGPQMSRSTNRQADKEIYFRIDHLAQNGHKGAPVAAYRDQTVKIALWPKGTFENETLAP